MIKENNTIEESIAEIWSELTGVKTVKSTDNFFEIGGTSVLAIRQFNIAKSLGLDVSIKDIYSYPILKDLAAKLSSEIDVNDKFKAVPIRRTGDELPLFFLPAGFDISYAFELSRDISPVFPVYGLPRNNDKFSSFSSMEELAADMLKMMKKVQPSGPYKIATCSSGGLLAYELAKQLNKENQRISFLGLIDSFSWFYEEKTVTQSFLNYVEEQILKFEDKLSYRREALTCWLETLSKMPLDNAIKAVREFNDLIFIKDKITDEVNFWQECHHYIHLCSLYKIEDFGLRITLFKANQKAMCLSNFIQESMGNKNKYFSDMYESECLGWDAYIDRDRIDLVEIDGDHFTMLENNENRAGLSHLINAELMKTL